MGTTKDQHDPQVPFRPNDSGKENHLAGTWLEAQYSSNGILCRNEENDETTTRGERHLTSRETAVHQEIGVCQPGSSISPSALLTEMIEKDKISRSHHALIC
eukprot:scaffold8311_cov93-Cylindrotheca_fusiformis.AAC.1